MTGLARRVRVFPKEAARSLGLPTWAQKRTEGTKKIPPRAKANLATNPSGGFTSTVQVRKKYLTPNEQDLICKRAVELGLAGDGAGRDWRNIVLRQVNEKLAQGAIQLETLYRADKRLFSALLRGMTKEELFDQLRLAQRKGDRSRIIVLKSALALRRRERYLDEHKEVSSSFFARDRMSKTDRLVRVPGSFGARRG